MRWLLALMVITVCLGSNNLVWGDTGNSQSNQNGEMCPISRAQAFATAVFALGMPVVSSLEAFVAILKPIDSVGDLFDNSLRTFLADEKAAVRLQMAIDRTSNAFVEIPSTIKEAGISWVAGPYWFVKGMYATVVGCSS